ncbi:capreomycidine synthase [Streptomyces sp. NPDC018045]|uniref:capreomycidine synthase n=1 Tax=Streptomyces sp. NPDC018045 TaxID=3365037 RepID=UPI0037B4B49E
MPSLRIRPEAPPILEEWYRRHLSSAVHDISSSGVQPYSFAEIRRLCGIRQQDLDGLVMDDSVSQGGEGIRQAIADRYCGGDADRVMATHGSSEAIALTLATLLRAGDRVVVQEGIYHSLGHYPRAAGCQVETLPLAAVQDGEVAPETLREVITPGTAALIVNFPHNPSGVSLSEKGLHALLTRLDEVGAVLVWDGAMAEVAHRWEVLPDPATLYERTVSYGTFSKTLGLPGLRVGWCVAPPELLRATFPLRDRTTLFLSPLVELIAARAMRAADQLVGRRAAQAGRNLAHLTTWAEEHRDFVRWTRPDGGVCGVLEVEDPAAPDAARTVEDFCRRLLAEHGTLLVPGSAFGVPHGVRLGFGGAEEEFRAGLERLSSFLRATGRRR